MSESLPPLIISRVTYRHLKTHRARYENSAIEAEAEVPAGEDAGAVLSRLQVWVRSQLAHEEGVADACDSLERLNDQLRWKREELARVTADTERAIAAIGESEVLIQALVREGQKGAALLLAKAIGKPWLPEQLQQSSEFKLTAPTDDDDGTPF